MPDWPVLAELGPELEVLEGSRGVLAVRRSARAAILAAGFLPDGGESLVPSDLVGRTRLGSFPLEDGGRAVVRWFSHGGLLSIVTGRRYADPERPFREAVQAERLAREGVRTPEVLAARAVRARRFGWELALVTRRVESVSDLGTVLEARRAGEGSEPGWRRLCARVGETVGGLHALGFLHADLHPRNLLVPEGALAGHDRALWVADLDRSRFVSPLPDDLRRGNLQRLLRAVLRREARGRPFLARADLLRFLRGYDRVLVREARAWREDWRRVSRRERLHRPWHRLGWGLERALGGSPAARDGAAAVRERPTP